MRTRNLRNTAAVLAAVLAISGCSGPEIPAGTSENTVSDASATAAVTTETTTTTAATEAQTTTAETSDQTETTTSSEETEVTGSDEQSVTGGEDDESLSILDYLPEEYEISPAMWKVSDPNSGNYIYIMGAMHTLPVNSFPLPELYEEAYEQSEGVAVEYDVTELTEGDNMNMDLIMQIASAYVYTDGTTLKDHISEDTYELLVDTMSEAIEWNQQYDYENINFWITQLSNLAIAQVEDLD